MSYDFIRPELPASGRSDWLHAGVPGTVSVIIPTYNRETFIPYAVESVMLQTRPVEEVIVVDDGSTDATLSVLNKLSMDYPTLKFYTQPNGGVASARNNAMAQSSGQYIAFLDSDDRFLPTKIEHCLDLFDKHPEAGTVYHAANVVDWETGAFQAYSKRNLSITFADALGRDFPGPQSIMVSRKVIAVIGGFDQSLKTSEDWELFMRLAEYAPTKGSPKALVNVSRGKGHQSLVTTSTKPWHTQTAILNRYKERVRSDTKLRKPYLQARRSIRKGVYWRHSQTIKSALQQKSYGVVCKATIELLWWYPQALTKLPAVIWERVAGNRRIRFSSAK